MNQPAFPIDNDDSKKPGYASKPTEAGFSWYRIF
jgi:hypothetical protein